MTKAGRAVTAFEEFLAPLDTLPLGQLEPFDSAEFPCYPEEELGLCDPAALSDFSVADLADLFCDPPE